MKHKYFNFVDLLKIGFFYYLKGYELEYLTWISNINQVLFLWCFEENDFERQTDRQQNDIIKIPFDVS